MIKYLGTHNSGTFSKLVWWQRPLSYILNKTSQCQTLNIEQQLESNVKLFNFQVTFYKNEWVFSHGLCIYTEKLMDAIKDLQLSSMAHGDNKLYFQLYLDKNVFTGQNVEEFTKLVLELKDLLEGTNIHMLNAWVEGTDNYIYKSSLHLDISEKYWTSKWAKDKKLLDKIPSPKKYAERYNEKHIVENASDYLMLDFIEIK